MKTLGIDADGHFLVYEGSSNWGYPIWPAPTLVAVSIVDESSAILRPGAGQRDVTTMEFILVDEGYDPTSRIRKGRLLKRREGVQPDAWYVQPHPAIHAERSRINANGVLEKRLGTYCAFSLMAWLNTQRIERPLFLVGSTTEFTIWSLVDIEATVSGEPLVYLRSRKVFGALPRLKTGVIPGEYRNQVEDKLKALEEDLYRAGPESIIDRCREAATAILSAYLSANGCDVKGKDLAKLALEIQSGAQLSKHVVANLAKTLGILHARGKTAEQLKRGVRPPVEEDADLAVQSVGLILRDLAWGD